MGRVIARSGEYTTAQITKGLSALIRHAGDAQKARRDLAGDDLIVTPEQLIEWRDKSHSALYVTLAEEQGRAIEELVAAGLRENALRQVRLEAEALDKIGERLPDANISEASKALDAIQKARSSGVDRVLSLTGRPVNGQTFDLEEIERKLKQRGLLRPRQPAIEGTAEEVPDE